MTSSLADLLKLFLAVVSRENNFAVSGVAYLERQLILYYYRHGTVGSL
jgi:hypothetical protein